VMIIEPCDDEFEYRIEDAWGEHYETKEVCLCSRQIGSPCNFCGLAVGDSRESVA
jgi:hypothetical protein